MHWDMVLRLLQQGMLQGTLGGVPLHLLNYDVLRLFHLRQLVSKTRSFSISKWIKPYSDFLSTSKYTTCVCWVKCSPLQPHASPDAHSPKQLKALYFRKITAGTQKWRFGKLFGFSKGWVFWFYVSFLGSILWIGLNIIKLPEKYQLCANRIEYAKSQPSHLMCCPNLYVHLTSILPELQGRSAGVHSPRGDCLISDEIDVLAYFLGVWRRFAI